MSQQTIGTIASMFIGFVAWLVLPDEHTRTMIAVMLMGLSLFVYLATRED